MARVLDGTSVVTHTGLCNPSLVSGNSPVKMTTAHQVPSLVTTDRLHVYIEGSFGAIAAGLLHIPKQHGHHIHPMETPVNDHTG